MLYALDHEGQRIRATPLAVGYCPVCKRLLQTHCGKIRIHHFQHPPGHSCEMQWEPMSDWHILWQLAFPEDAREVLTKTSTGWHKADVQLPNGIAIEFQRAKITAAEVQARTEFHLSKKRRILWVVYCRRPSKNGQPRVQISKEPTSVDGRPYYEFRWRSPRTCFRTCPEVYLDISPEYLFKVAAFTSPNGNRGLGGWIRRDQFIKTILHKGRIPRLPSTYVGVKS